MEIRPFPCTRRAGAHDRAASAGPGAGAGSCASAPTVTDAGRALYACRFATEAATVTGVLCALPARHLTDGALTCSERLRPADEGAFEAEVSSETARLAAEREQDEPVTLAFADVPVLSYILGAATEATPLYELRLGKGARGDAVAGQGVPGTLRVWRIGRADAVEALSAIFERVGSAVVVDQRSHVLAEALELLAAEGCLESSGLLALLVPYGELTGGIEPRLLRGLFRRALG